MGVRTSGTSYMTDLVKNSIFCSKTQDAEISETSKCALCVSQPQKNLFLNYKIDQVFAKKFSGGYSKNFLPSQKTTGEGQIAVLNAIPVDWIVNFSSCVTPTLFKFRAAEVQDMLLKHVEMYHTYFQHFQKARISFLLTPQNSFRN